MYDPLNTEKTTFFIKSLKYFLKAVEFQDKSFANFTGTYLTLERGLEKQLESSREFNGFMEHLGMYKWSKHPLYHLRHALVNFKESFRDIGLENLAYIWDTVTEDGPMTVFTNDDYKRLLKEGKRVVDLLEGQLEFIKNEEHIPIFEKVVNAPTDKDTYSYTDEENPTDLYVHERYFDDGKECLASRRYHLSSWKISEYKNIGSRHIQRVHIVDAFKNDQGQRYYGKAIEYFWPEELL